MQILVLPLASAVVLANVETPKTIEAELIDVKMNINERRHDDNQHFLRICEELELRQM